MNNFKLLFSCCALATGLLVSCSNDSNLPDNGNPNAILLKSTVTNLSVKTFNPNVQIANAQQVGVYINENAATPEVTYNPNLVYTADGSGGLTPTEVQYYPSNGNAVKISAYHPYNSGVADQYDFAVSTDQSVDANYYSSDLLYSLESVYSNSASALNLPFKHLLSKVSYQILTPGYEDATVEILNVQTNAGFNRLTGAVSAPSAATTANVVLNAAYGAVVVPQTIAVSSVVFKVTKGAEVFQSPALVTALTFDAGKAYKYNISVAQEGLVVTQGDITDWNVDPDVIEGGTQLAAPTVTFSPSFTEAGNTVTLTGTNLDKVTSVTFNGTTISFSDQTATAITLDMSAITATTTGDIVFNGNATAAVAGFTVYKSQLLDGNFENLTALGTTVDTGIWGISGTGITAYSIEQDPVQGNVAKLEATAVTSSWFNPFFGQKFEVTESGKYKVSFKAKAGAGNSQLMFYIRIGSSGNNFIIKEGTNTLTTNQYPYRSVDPVATEWTEYSQVFDFDFFTATSAGYPGDSATAFTDAATSVFTLIIHPNKNNTYEIDDIVIEKVN